MINLLLLEFNVTNFFSKGPFRFFRKLRLEKSEKHQRVPPLENFFLSPILMKLKILNPYGLGISHMKFERNLRRKYFWHRRVPPLDFSELCKSISFLDLGKHALKNFFQRGDPLMFFWFSKSQFLEKYVKIFFVSDFYETSD